MGKPDASGSSKDAGKRNLLQIYLGAKNNPGCLSHCCELGTEKSSPTGVFLYRKITIAYKKTGDKV